MKIYKAKPEDGAAWVTGASSGIGRQTVLELARKGFTVYASARSEDELKELSSEHSGPGTVIPLPLDVTDRKKCDRAVRDIASQAGGLSLAIFNAGSYWPVKGNELQFDQFEASMNLNFFGVLNGLIPAIDEMKKAGQGHVALVSSSAGYAGLPRAAAYGASKSALINMAESLKFDLDQLNIRIQVVTPGFVKTPLTDRNKFSMPFLMEVEDAAKSLVEGLSKNVFDITFPKRFTLILKVLTALPYRFYFPIVARQTGVTERKAN